MTTLSIHACSPSLSTVKMEVANAAVRPYVILSLLPPARGLGSRRGMGPSLRRHSGKGRVLVVPRASLGQLPDPEHVDLALRALSKSPEALQGLLTRTEGLFFTLADAAVATDPSQVTNAVVPKQDGGWLGGITNTLELALTVSILFFFDPLEWESYSSAKFCAELRQGTLFASPQEF